jgi:hypothetical protein
MSASSTFESETRLVYRVSTAYDTADSLLASWESNQRDLAFDVFKIMPIQSQTFSVVLGATPDQPFQIAAYSKFNTNMDGKPEFSAYDKSQLQYTYTCTNPTVGSDADLATSNDCCSLAFNWNASNSVLTKINADYTKYCDGVYTVNIQAKNAAFPLYK